MGSILVKDTVEGKSLVFNAFAVGDNTFRELLYRAVFRRVEDSERTQSIVVVQGTGKYSHCTHRHLSSITLIIDRIPFWLSFGVGAPAKEPSPRKRGPSSHFEICAASLIVKGLTLTATVIDEASLGIAILLFVEDERGATSLQAESESQVEIYRRGEGSCRNIQRRPTPAACRNNDEATKR